MVVPEFESGEWLAVVEAGCMAIVPPSSDPQVLRDLWAAMRRGEDLIGLLLVLTGGRFDSIPPFALASIEGKQLHAVVRGSVEIHTVIAGEINVLNAESVTTWLEQILDDVATVSLVMPGGRPISRGAGWPVASGIVPANSVRWDLEPEPEVDESDGEAPAQTAAEAELVAQLEAEINEALSDEALGVQFDQAASHGTDASAAAVTDEPAAEGELSAADEPAAEDELSAADEPAAESAAEDEPAADEAQEPEPIAPLAAHAPPPPPPAEADADLGDPDHDGMTVLAPDVVALREQLPVWDGAVVPGPYQSATDDRPIPKIVLSSGLVVALDRPVLLGRAPQARRAVSDSAPRLVTVASPNQDISRTHAEVRLEGDAILVTDLRSTNGVLLTRPGASPQRLHPGEPTAVDAGAVVDLGEGVTFVVGRGA